MILVTVVIAFMSMAIYSEGGTVAPFCSPAVPECQKRILVPANAEVVVTPGSVTPAKVVVTPAVVVPAKVEVKPGQ